MPWKVTVTRIDEADFAPSSYEKIADSGNPLDGGAQYAHVHGPIEKRTVETEIFSETFEALNVKSVVAWLNMPRLTPS